MAGQINSVVTVDLNVGVTVDGDDSGTAILFGDPDGGENPDVAFTVDLAGQMMTVILSMIIGSDATAGEVTGQLCGIDTAGGGGIDLGPSFVLPNKLDGKVLSVMPIVTFAPGQNVGGLGIRITDVGGSGLTHCNLRGVTVIVSD